ncbi:hypothetical protein POM88_031217 [Heracleum sosnowskyi]|uniref:Phylloplanin n=1 Tax=Heracleum sosnowskyi TaxID=360622 RepID=A0AAD8HWZ2_9APIA|nr:hypothetical protein POM88_031217 [Heracleum sosnowskyi]
MALRSSTNSSFLLISALVFLFSTPSLGILNLPTDDLSRITQLQVLGFLTCPLTSIPLLGSILGTPGVPISVTCNGINIADPRAVTAAFGFFSIPITGFNNTALAIQPDQPISCSVAINFPVSGTSCLTFPSTGSLQAPLSFGSVVNNGLGNLIALLNPGPFQYRA